MSGTPSWRGLPEKTMARKKPIPVLVTAVMGAALARTAVSAKAAPMTAVTRTGIGFFRAMVFSGKPRHDGVPDMTSTATRRLAGFRNRPDGKLKRPRRFQNMPYTPEG